MNDNDQEMLQRISKAIEEGRQPTREEMEFALRKVQESGLDPAEIMANAEQALQRFGQAEGVNMDNFMERARISAVVHYDLWAQLLEQLVGWTLTDVDEKPDYLCPFAYTTDKEGEIFALYATSLAYSPGDEDDEMANHLLSQIADIESKAVLFFKKPLIKYLDGKAYGYYGKVLLDGQWSDFLLAHHRKGIDAVLEQVGKDINQPSPEFADEQTMLARSFTVYLDGYDPQHDKVNLYGVANERTGWIALMTECES